MLYNVCIRQVRAHVLEKIADSDGGTCTVSRRQRGYIVSEDDARARQYRFTSSAIVDLEVHASI